jgi:membrane-associated phospholipid phosphatase
MLDETWLPKSPPLPLRRLNLWLLRNASIHANTFPSAHAASSSGAALALAYLAPWPVGVVFGALAAGIGFGTLCGRYHYVLDAVAGSGVALVWFRMVIP